MPTLCQAFTVNWTATLIGTRQDVERLLAELPDGLLGDPEHPGQLRVQLADPGSDADPGEEPHAAKAAIDALVDRLNAIAKLRWGRMFDGVAIGTVESVDASGRRTQYGFVGPAVDHMLPEDFAGLVEKLGHPRPALPEGWEEIKSLDLGAVQRLAGSTPAVGRALHLLGLSLARDDLDWVTTYSAIEIVIEDLRGRGADGSALGLWSAKELKDFKATANSPGALGFRARHGKSSGVTSARMNDKDASWFLRRVIARWVVFLLERKRIEA